MSIDNDEFFNAIEAIIPKCLDEIIRHNRDFAQVRLTTDIEVMKLYASITPSHVKELLMIGGSFHWHLNMLMVLFMKCICLVIKRVMEFLA